VGWSNWFGVSFSSSRVSRDGVRNACTRDPDLWAHKRSLLGVVLIKRAYWRVHGVHGVCNSWHYGIGHVPPLVWSSPLPSFS